MDIVSRARRTLATGIVRPYIYRELPAWGKLFKLVVGDHRREWLWRGQTKTVVDKLTGYALNLDLGWWSDRMTYFLGRWYDLQSPLVISQHVKAGDIVVDVGANRGMFALYASKAVGWSGKVICFEPNPTCIATLNQTIHDNGISNIEIRETGLSDRAETLNLMVPACDTGIGTFAGYGNAKDEKAVPCTVVIGDDALRDISPNFIKIDVEGFEPRVIRGLAKTIEAHKPIIYMEMVPDHLERAGSSAKELISLMEGLGYRGHRVSYESRCPTECTYAELTDPITECDVLWKPRQD